MTGQVADRGRRLGLVSRGGEASRSCSRRCPAAERCRGPGSAVEVPLSTATVTAAGVRAAAAVVSCCPCARCWSAEALLEWLELDCRPRSATSRTTTIAATAIAPGGDQRSRRGPANRELAPRRGAARRSAAVALQRRPSRRAQAVCWGGVRRSPEPRPDRPPRRTTRRGTVGARPRSPEEGQAGASTAAARVACTPVRVAEPAAAAPAAAVPTAAPAPAARIEIALVVGGRDQAGGRS